MLSSSRLPVSRWKVAAWWAAHVGWIVAGRKATMKRSRRARAESAAHSTHASSQPAPVGVSAPVKPACSAARATSPR